MRNNSRTKDIFHNLSGYIYFCIEKLPEWNFNLANSKPKAKTTETVDLKPIIQLILTHNFNAMSRKLHLCPFKFYQALTVCQFMLQKLFCTLKGISKLSVDYVSNWIRPPECTAQTPYTIRECGLLLILTTTCGDVRHEIFYILPIAIIAHKIYSNMIIMTIYITMDPKVLN